MSNTHVELTLEYESGLTEQAVESMLRDYFGDDLTEIEVKQG